MKFFFDVNIGENLVYGLRCFGENVVHSKELNFENVEDSVWLQYIGERGLVLITRDERVRLNPAEITAIHKYKVKAFFVGGKNIGKCQLIRQIVRIWPRIKELSRKERPPFIYRIRPNGERVDRVNL